LRGLTLSTGTPNPLVCVGGSQGQLRFDDVGADGGTRAIQTMGLAVAYPLTLHDFRARNQRDRQLWFYRAIFSARDVDLGYGVRAAASLVESFGGFEDAFIAPPSPAQDAVFEQRGGRVSYTRVTADYEYRPAPPVVRVRPASDEGPTRPTVARLVDCEGGASELFALLPRAAGYTGPCRVEVDGAAVAVV
jgi:hypothetical protein